MRTALINEQVLGDLLISTQHDMGSMFNMQLLVEGFVNLKTPEAQKAMADSLNQLPDFLLKRDDASVG